MGDLTIFVVESVDYADYEAAYDICSLWFTVEEAGAAIEKYKAYDEGTLLYRIASLIVGKLYLPGVDE